MKQLKNGTWVEVYPVVDTSKQVDFTGATSSAAGKKGSVPAPAAGKNEAFLKGDGTWSNVVSGTLTATTFKTSSGIEIY